MKLDDMVKDTFSGTLDSAVELELNKQWNQVAQEFNLLNRLGCIPITSMNDRKQELEVFSLINEPTSVDLRRPP